MYADYVFYMNDYRGKMSETDYNRLAVRAYAEINRITFNRAATASGADLEAVKFAECAVVDELAAQEEGGVITSETNDGVSRSYATGTVVKSASQRIYAAAEVFLSSTNLCFAGV